MTKIYVYRLDDGTIVSNRPSPNTSYTELVSMFAKNGYIFQNIYTGKMLNALTTPVGTENFWKEVLLDEKE